MKLVKASVWGLLALSLLAGTTLSWVFGSVMTRSTNRAVPAALAPAVTVSIESDPGIVLKGDYWRAAGKGRPAVLMLHGNGGNRGNVTTNAAWLASKGYGVLAIDFRGHGESTPSGKSFGVYEARDAHAAFNWLKAKDPGARIGVIGYSLGGAAAIIGDQGPLPADAMVLQAVYLDIRRAIGNRINPLVGSTIGSVFEPMLSYQAWFRFGRAPGDISLIKALAKVKTPVMIVGGGADNYTPRTEMEALFNAAKRNGEIWILEGRSHNQVVSERSDVFREKLLRFLDRHLDTD